MQHISTRGGKAADSHAEVCISNPNPFEPLLCPSKQIKYSIAFIRLLVPTLVQPRGLTASGTSANLNTLGRLSSTLIRFAVRNCKKCFRTSYLLVWGVGDLWDSKLILNKFILKGQIISKCFFLAEDSPKKRTKTSRILVKTNSFVCFLGESLAWQFFSKLTDL